MNADELIKAIERELEDFTGGEREMLEALAPMAESWLMRLRELSEED